MRLWATFSVVLLACAATAQASEPERLIEIFRSGDESARADALERLYTLGPPAEAAMRQEALRLLATLREGDAASREDALNRLSDLGRAVVPVLEEALHDNDPDFRFNVLFLLHEPAGRLKRFVRAVVEGKASNAASYPEAITAYQALLDLAGKPETCRTLARLVRREALGSSSAKGRYVCFGLSMIRALVQRNPALGTEELAFDLAGLLEVDLRVGHHELISAFSVLPAQHTLKALDASLAAGRPMIRARAARVLAEALPAARAGDAAHRIVPLFKHPNTLVRISALRAIDLLGLPGDALVPVVPLVKDRDPQVASEALRIAGTHRLSVVREAAEGLAANLDTPAQLRRRAVVTLGLLGPGSSGPLLRRLANPRSTDKRLAALGAWAMGCSRAPQARTTIQDLLDLEGFAYQDLLFRGLARLGGEEGLAALERVLEFKPGVPPKRAWRARAVVALGFIRDAPAASGILGDLAANYPVARLGMPGPTGREIEAALDALADRGDDEARIRLGQLLVKKRGTDVKQLVDLIARIGGPRGDATLTVSLAHTLGSIAANNNSTFVRASAATALSKVDPLRAQSVLLGLLRRGQHPRTARELARALARAGDRSQIELRALRYSRGELERADASDRADLLNDVGIDLLYGGRLAEALLEFRRMLWCRPNDKIATYNVACGYALAGDVEPALRYLRRSIGLDYRNHRHIEYDTDLDSLHSDIRYQRLIEQLKLFEETGVALPKLTWPGAVGGR